MKVFGITTAFGLVLCSFAYGLTVEIDDSLNSTEVFRGLCDFTEFDEISDHVDMISFDNKSFRSFMSSNLCGQYYGGGRIFINVFSGCDDYFFLNSLGHEIAHSEWETLSVHVRKTYCWESGFNNHNSRGCKEDYAENRHTMYLT